MLLRVENIKELRGHKLFNGLSDSELERVAMVCFKKRHSPGQTLFLEGMHGGILYVILSGELELFRHNGEDEVAVAKLGAGEFIGEGSMVLNGNRSTGCRVSKESELLFMTKNAFQELSKSNPSITNKILNQFLKTSIVRLRSHPFISID